MASAEQLASYLQDLESADEAVRAYAAEDIGSLNDPDGIAPLARRLDQEASPAVREAIFSALNAITHPRAIDCAAELLGHEDPFVRNRAVELLRRRDGQCLPVLGKLIRHPSADLRKLAVDVLFGVESRGTEPLYQAALSDADLNVVITAVECAGKARKRECAGKVQELLRAAAHPMLSLACLETLVIIGDESAWEVCRTLFPNAAQVPGLYLPAWLRLAGRQAGHLDANVVAGLLSSASGAVQEAALDCISALCSRGLLPDTAETTKALARLVESPAPSLVRAQALRLLAGLADTEETGALVRRQLAGSDEVVRGAAAEAAAKRTAAWRT